MTSLTIDFRGKLLDLSSRTHIMGVINCTPDSFYGGSRKPDAQAAIQVGLTMVEQGADLLDVGGESTRPGSEPVSLEDEWRRIAPVLEELLRATDLPISVDTYKAEIAHRALKMGAHIVNDISGLRFDENMVKVVAEFDVPAIIMHIKGAPRDMQEKPTYEDVVVEISDYFERQIEYALSHGISAEKIILDPGIGFGKRIRDNYEILRRLSEFGKFQRPILIGHSRKSFIGKLLDVSPDEALEGTLAAGTAAILAGAHILRVHDVLATKRAATVADHIIGKTQQA